MRNGYCTAEHYLATNNFVFHVAEGSDLLCTRSLLVVTCSDVR